LNVVENVAESVFLYW